MYAVVAVLGDAVSVCVWSTWAAPTLCGKLVQPDLSARTEGGNTGESVWKTTWGMDLQMIGADSVASLMFRFKLVIRLGELWARGLPPGVGVRVWILLQQ